MPALWKRQLSLVAAVSLIFASLPSHSAAAFVTPARAAAPARTDFPSVHEVIVKFRPASAGAVSASAVATTAVTGRGGMIIQQDRQAGMLVRLPAAPADAAALIEALKSMPDVAYVENNGVMKALGAPTNDPDYAKLWGLDRMNAPAAWTTGAASGPRVVVAVVDTGVDGAHEDLAGRVLPGFNVITGDRNTKDDFGHGTHVSGTIAAAYNNGLGITGITGPANVRILPVKVLDASGQGSYYSVARGIDWAVDHGAQVINLSLGGGHSNVVQDAVLRAELKGVVVVAAAGNEAADTAFVSPADVPGVVTVAALDQDDTPAWFSNYGDQVEVIAPGVSILSTVPGGTYEAWNGTSMASPHVAGLVALVKAAHPEFSRWAIQACIYDAVDQIALPAGFGYGVPRAERALACDPAQLDSKYALKVEGPDPDTPVYAPTLWFDAKPAGGRIRVTDQNGVERGGAPVTAEGLVSVTPELTGLPPGPKTLTAALSDESGATVATQSITLNIGAPGAAGIGLQLSTNRLNPAKESLRITTALTGSTHYSMYVFDGQGNVVRTLVNDRTYTGPVTWNGTAGSGKRVPDGQYFLYAVTDTFEEAFADFAVRVPPTPITPTLSAPAAVNVPRVPITGKVNPNFGVDVRVKAPGAADFTAIGTIATAAPDGTYAAQVDLAGGDGTYEIQVRGVDLAEAANASRWSASARVLFDGTAPVVRLTSPAVTGGVITTNSNRLSLSGMAEPGATVTAAAGAGSKTVTADSKGVWKLELPLPTGADSLSITAVDRVGNRGPEQRFRLTVDTSAPVLAADSLVLQAGSARLTANPSRGTYGFSTAVAPTYVLTGVMSEPVGKVVPSNRKFVVSTSGSSFSVDLTPGLVSGTNTLSFDIYDLAGNKMKLSATVTVDGKKPTVTVTERDVTAAPKRDASGAPQPVPATFTVTASEPLSAVQIVWDSDRSPEGVSVTQTPSGDRRRWTISMVFPAADAAWSFQFAGVDLVGNVGDPDRRTRRRVTVDGTAPVLALTNRTDGVIFSPTTSFTVSGTVTDAGAGIKSLTVGRVPVRPNSDGRVSTRVMLTEGKVTAIPVVVVDLAGNTHTETIQVLAKTKVNGLSIRAQSLPETREVVVSGKTDAPIRLPDGRFGARVPVNVVVTDGQGSVLPCEAAVADDGTYTVMIKAGDWPPGRYNIKVTAGTPDELAGAGTAFRTKTVQASVTIR